MKIIATKILSKDLKPGDLFSTVDQAYWNNIKGSRSIGKKIYIRTEEPCPSDQLDVEIYKIRINQ